MTDEPRTLIEVRRGNPTDEEVAAVITAIMAAAVPPVLAVAKHDRAAAWRGNAAQYRKPPSAWAPAPSVWRLPTSAWTRC